LFEAILSAIYLSAGLEKSRDFVLEILQREYPDPRKLLNSLNPKGQLQEFVQGKWKSVPVYRTFRQGGPQHCPFYEVEVAVGRFVAIGSGSNRKLAEVNAAEKLWSFLYRRFGDKRK
jgi:ribonuclease-3